MALERIILPLPSPGEDCSSSCRTRPRVLNQKCFSVLNRSRTCPVCFDFICQFLTCALVGKLALHNGTEFGIMVIRDIIVAGDCQPRVFHASYGISPKQYLLKLKMDKAAQMLVSTEMPVALIAEALGFEDQHVFSRAFKKYWGVSPMLYRKEQGIRQQSPTHDL